MGYKINPMSFKTKVINLRELSQLAGVSEHKVYRRKYIKDSKPLELKDRTKLVNALAKETIQLAKDLGFTITLGLEESQDRHR